MDGSPTIKPLRARIFIDFWNFSLSLRREREGFLIDWTKVPKTMIEEAQKIAAEAGPVAFEALHVYGSFDPAKPDDGKFKRWFDNWLDKQPGVHTVLLERQRKRGFPKCPKCHDEVEQCPSCSADMRGTEEKGVDTRMVTDMISLAWAEGYDLAILVSSDRDFVPVAEFLQAKAIKVIHCAFPPKGSELSQKCWGNFNMASEMGRIELIKPKKK